MKVYLAGPISGLTFKEGQDWREQAKVSLAATGIQAYSPLRAKQYLSDRGELSGSYDEYPLSTSKGITTRDRWDVMTSDAVLFYLKGAKAVSIGTCIEFGWADAFRKPIIVVMDKGELHEHPMIREVAGYFVSSLDDAVILLNKILLP
jgi:nucleoside 2-deoxyribosyltransferase